MKLRRTGTHEVSRFVLTDKIVYWCGNVCLFVYHIDIRNPERLLQTYLVERGASIT
jgi:hypothetical protein